MWIGFRLWILLLMSLYTSVGLAKTIPTYTFIFAVQEQRFSHLLSELRCLVCQNQSLAESNAPLAQDLKNEVYHRIRSGWSDQEIKGYLVQRYGEYILFKPDVNKTTFVLWLGPVVFLVGAFVILFINIQRRQSNPCR